MPCSILLVEDNKTDIDLIQRAIQKMDSDVRLEIAQDGEQALACLKKWGSNSSLPIIILLDLNLPKMSGLEVLRALKTHPRHKVIPVVVLTSSNEASNLEQAYKLGANSYIMKSVNYDEFASAIASIHHYWCELNIHPE